MFAAPSSRSFTKLAISMVIRSYTAELVQVCKLFVRTGNIVLSGFANEQAILLNSTKDFTNSLDETFERSDLHYHLQCEEVQPRIS
jgi:hypothetical protein